MQRAPSFVHLILVTLLVTSCTGGGQVSTGTFVGAKGKGKASPRATQPAPKADTSTAQQDIQQNFTGTVTGLDGKPAPGIVVKGFILSENSAGIISNNGANIISNSSGTYRVSATNSLETTTDEQGRFTLKAEASSLLNVEAVAAADVKAIKLEVPGNANGLQMKLAHTGSISGKVTAPNAPTVKNFEGVDVFIPGTSYLAKADANGRYTITNVAVGSFTIVGSKTGLGKANAQGVRVESKQTTTAPDLALSVTAPTLKQLSSIIGGPEAEITLTGQNFGASTGAPFQVLISGAVVADPKRLDDQTIKFKVPNLNGNSGIVSAPGTPASVGVSIDGIQSNLLDFRVINELTVNIGATQGKLRASLEGKVLFAKGSTTRLSLQIWDGNVYKPISAPNLSVMVDGTIASFDSEGGLMAKELGDASIVIASGVVKTIVPIRVVNSLEGIPSGEYPSAMGPLGVIGGGSSQ